MEEEGIYSDYSEDMLNFFKYEGNQIAIPYMVGYRGFFYRTDYLEQAGVEKVPETWDELLDACAKLKAWNPDIVPACPHGRNQRHLALLHELCHEQRRGHPWMKTSSPPPRAKRSSRPLICSRNCAEGGYVAEGVLGHDGAAAETLYYSGKAAFFFGSFGTTESTITPK